jgi:hypothetical protein
VAWWVAFAGVIVALFVVGALAVPVTGVVIGPDVRGARHGAEMIVELGRFGWYGYCAVSVALLAVGLVAVRRSTPQGHRRAASMVSALLALTVVFGLIHVSVVATGMFAGAGRPLPATVAGVVGCAAVCALAFARARLRTE